MKKFVLLMVTIIMCTIAYGQKNVRQTASNYLRSGKLDLALEAINECIKEPTTAQDPKTWQIRGNIFLEIANSTNEKYQNLDSDPTARALESFKKAVEYDTKKDLFEEIFIKLNEQRNKEYNLAAESYNSEDFVKATSGFAHAAAIMAAVGVVDTAALLYTAYCATLSGDYETAIKYYEELLKQKYNVHSVYVSLSDIYRIKKDKENAMRIIQEGKNALPENTEIFLQETTVFLTFDMADAALSNLLTYVETDTLNYSVYFAIGTIYDKFVNDTVSDKAKKEDAFMKAIVAYKKTLALNPEFFDAYYNLGALYVNTAAIIDMQANTLPLDKVAEYEALKAEANKYLEQAAPYLEKAIAMQPNDINTLQVLRQIYARTNQTEKLKEVTIQIDELSR